MALTRSAFRTLYSEFDRVEDATVDAKLAEAEDRLSEDYFGDRFDNAHGLMTAHLIAISPAGRQARLDPKKAEGNTTTYQRELGELLKENAPGPTVL